MSWDFKRLEVQENERRRKYLYFIVLTVLTAAFLMVGGVRPHREAGFVL
jgi:hypothetical protein